MATSFHQLICQPSSYLFFLFFFSRSSQPPTCPPTYPPSVVLRRRRFVLVSAAPLSHVHKPATLPWVWEWEGMVGVNAVDGESSGDAGLCSGSTGMAPSPRLLTASAAI